ncbi:MAG TPA: thiamine-phosphate kinase [Polyangiaceae bacterium]|nr:thiamine-phosphate kinase [Polyangiaceae bacterium]
MSAPKSSEFQRIARIQRLLEPSGGRGSALDVGIGDDAAVLRVTGRVVWTVDAQVEGVHFDRRWLSLRDIGYRSFQAAASDLAAMGARATAALSSLSLPASLGDDELEGIVRGQAEAARACACPIVGGNLSRGGELSLTTTVLGSAPKPLLRSEARVGDELWLVGEVGMAAAGLQALMQRARKTSAVAACIERWRRPHALLREGRILARRARAAIDVSDGLAGDARHMAKASGVRLVLARAALEAALSPELVTAAPALGLSALETALSGGEDYALLCSGKPDRRPPFAHAVGRVERGAGVWLEFAGRRKKLTGSFDHFATK